MFDTRNELLNLISIVSMSLVFLDPDETINQADMLNHNNLYMGFDLEESLDSGSAGARFGGYEDDEEGWF